MIGMHVCVCVGGEHECQWAFLGSNNVVFEIGSLIGLEIADKIQWLANESQG